MPRRSVLSASQRASFEALPIEPAELARHYTLSEEDLALIRARRRAENRLGFAVQLCLIRYPGRILRANEQPPGSLIAFVAEQLDCHADDFADYAHRDQTRREHIASLIHHFQLATFTGFHFRERVRWLIFIAVENPKSVFLVGAVLNELRHRRILHPPLRVVERMVATAQLRADQQVFSQIHKLLNNPHRETLDRWLTPETEHGQSRLSWVRQPLGRPCPANVMAILERLTAIRDLNLPDRALEELPLFRRQLLAREGSRVAIQNLRLFSEARRYAVMAISLLETQRSLVDEAISMHDRIVGRLIRRSKRKQADQLQEDAKRIKRTLSLFAVLSKALIHAKETGQDAWQTIDRALPWHELRALAEDAEEPGG